MRIEPATAADLGAVQALLVDAGLPLDGAMNAFSSGVVARDGERVVGAVAIEPFGDAGLLRSVVVAPDRRGTGIARRLVAQAEALARTQGIREMYLITETASDYFPRLGYGPVARSIVPEALAGSVEFTTACSTSAIVMRRRLA